MLPIATVQGVREGISTGMIIDLSEYLKKAEGVSKEEFNSLEEVVGQKLDSEPIHKHHIEDIKQLESVLNNKFDKGEKYSYNVILSDSEKIPFLESPKILTMEIASKFDVEGYKFYVDDSNGDLMIILNGVLIGHYSKSGNKWLLNGITETIQNSMNNYATINHVHEDYATKNMLDEQTVIENVNIINPDDFVLECTTDMYMTATVISNYSLLKTKVEVACNVSGAIMTRVITIGENETDISINDNEYIESISYNDSGKKVNIEWTLRVGSLTGTAKVIESTHTETQETNIKTKINELENILQNHYQALKILCEKHEMIDSNADDGSNITPE